MATCAVIGQALGTAVKYAVENDLSPRNTCQKHIREIQEKLLSDDCHIPRLRRSISTACRNAKLIASSGSLEDLRNGVDRILSDISSGWECRAGDYVEYDFGQEMEFRQIRLVFDSNLERSQRDFGHLNMVSNYFAEMPVYEPPQTLVKAYHIEADGKEIFREANNYQRFIRRQINFKAAKIRLIIDSVYGEGSKRIFAFEVK